MPAALFLSSRKTFDLIFRSVPSLAIQRALNGCCISRTTLRLLQLAISSVGVSDFLLILIFYFGNFQSHVANEIDAEDAVGFGAFNNEQQLVTSISCSANHQPLKRTVTDVKTKCLL